MHDMVILAIPNALSLFYDDNETVYTWSLLGVSAGVKYGLRASVMGDGNDVQVDKGKPRQTTSLKDGEL